MKFLMTNARSLLPKIASLMDCFVELELSFAMISETWLKNTTSDVLKSEIKNNHKLEIIHKNRPLKPDGSIVTGGGVAIVYDPSKIHLKPYKIKKSNHEIVAAFGKLPNIKRKILIICAYIPPKARASSSRSVLNMIRETIANAKKNSDNPFIVLGGDFNRHKFHNAVDVFLDIEIHELGATCGGAELDRLATNIQDIRLTRRQPLCDVTKSRRSDHMVILAQTALNNTTKFRKRKLTYMKYTEEGGKEFGKLLMAVDWPAEFSGVEETPTALVEKMNCILKNIEDKCFEKKTRLIKSNDPPWMTRQLKCMFKKRSRTYRKQERPPLWKWRKKETDRLIAAEKRKYYERIKTKLKEEGSNTLPYKAIKELKGGERPPPWDVRDIAPHLNDDETANQLADYFNAISREFSPLQASGIPESYDAQYVLLQPHEVSKRLRHFKKPKSRVKGDIFPRLVTDYSDLLAVPLTKIFNLTMWTYHWPTQWKLETVTVIPKGSNAGSYGECRNLSCTPLFSKVCESYMLDRINTETNPDPLQYGGIKKCGVEHFLLQSWDKILRGLEDNRGSIGLISIDFAKAFNRMSHQACINAFKKKGASNQTLNLIASFLCGRRMSVKINESFSTHRAINGGSPQGCVSANALFCTTIEFLQEGSLENSLTLADYAVLETTGPSLPAGDTIIADAVSFGSNGVDLGPIEEELDPDSFMLGPISPPSSFVPRVFSSPQSPGRINYSSHVEEDSFTDLRFTDSPAQRHQAGFMRPTQINDTPSDGEPEPLDAKEIIGGLDRWNPSEPWGLKYIDDGLNGEVLCNEHAITHITQSKQQKVLHAKLSEHFLHLTSQNATK